MAASRSVKVPIDVNLAQVHELYNECKNLYTMTDVTEQKKIHFSCKGDLFFGFALVIEEKTVKTFIKSIVSCSFKNTLSFSSIIENKMNILYDVLCSLDAIKFVKGKAIILMSRLFMKATNPLVLNIIDTNNVYSFLINFECPISCSLMIINFDSAIIPSNPKLLDAHFKIHKLFTNVFGGPHYMISYPFAVSRWNISQFSFKNGKKFVLPFEPPTIKKTLLLRIDNGSDEPLKINSIKIANTTYSETLLKENTSHPFFAACSSDLYLRELDKNLLNLPSAICDIIIDYTQSNMLSNNLFAFDIDPSFKFPTNITLTLKNDVKELNVIIGYTNQENYQFKSNTVWSSRYDNCSEEIIYGDVAIHNLIPTGKRRHRRTISGPSGDEYFEPTASMLCVF